MRLLSLTAIALAVCLMISAGPVLAGLPSKTLSPYFFIENGDEGTEHFPLKSTSVMAVINGVIADVNVTQQYANMGNRPINASYIFPASTRAAVHGMRMTVGEEVVVAQIKKREAAKKEFSQGSGQKRIPAGAAASTGHRRHGLHVAPQEGIEIGNRWHLNTDHLITLQIDNCQN